LSDAVLFISPPNALLCGTAFSPAPSALFGLVSVREREQLVPGLKALRGFSSMGATSLLLV